MSAPVVTAPLPMVAADGKPAKRRLPLLPVAQLLETQRSLTAVDRFSKLHESPDAPLHAKFYRDLIPLDKPKPGEQYAFEVDLDACTGCKACVVACHNLNGLDEGELWRTVGLAARRHAQGAGAADRHHAPATTASSRPACWAARPRPTRRTQSPASSSTSMTSASAASTAR